jgi:hypothetical protein
VHCKKNKQSAETVKKVARRVTEIFVEADKLEAKTRDKSALPLCQRAFLSDVVATPAAFF